MRVVLNKTLRNMYKPTLVIIYFMIVLFFTVIISISNLKNNSLSIINQIEQIKITYSIFNYLFLSGVGLILLIMIFGLDIFATEEYEGTMRILIAKPVSRKSIIMGKILGILIGIFIYYISSLIISFALYSLILGLDKDVFVGVINIIPSFIIYSLFIIVIVTSLTTILSSVFRKKTPAIVIFILLILGIYGVLPIIRSITIETGDYQKANFQYFDINAHLGNTYMYLIEGGKEENELGDNMLSLFTSRYFFNSNDPDISSDGTMLLQKNDTINVPIVITIYMLISSILYYISYNIMTKKDIT